MSRESKLTICSALVIAIGFGVPKVAAQSDRYPKMARPRCKDRCGRL